jgi:hypothetical protein
LCVIGGHCCTINPGKATRCVCVMDFGWEGGRSRERDSQYAFAERGLDCFSDRKTSHAKHRKINELAYAHRPKSLALQMQLQLPCFTKTTCCRSSLERFNRFLYMTIPACKQVGWLQVRACLPVRLRPVVQLLQLLYYCTQLRTNASQSHVPDTRQPILGRSPPPGYAVGVRKTNHARCAKGQGFPKLQDLCRRLANEIVRSPR